MIEVKSDPKHPRGGYAQLRLADNAIAGESTQVAVFDNYSERFLGEAGWQPNKVMFGPYSIDRSAGDARIVIGPEIVNQIEEYANVKIWVGDVSQDVSWPDEVAPAPGAARIGGILTAGETARPPESALKAKIAEPEPEMVPETETPNEPEFEPQPEPVPDGGKRGFLVAALVALLALGGAAYWYIAQSDEDTEPVAQPQSTATPVAQSAEPCSAEALRALDGFPAQLDALRLCGPEASADVTLGLVESAVGNGDATALLLFGTVYDGQVTDSDLEDQIGFTFGDVPATAAEYYARAVEAGSDEAPERLKTLCARMSDMSDTLVQGAFADHCSE
ncbi:MAG: hypothetical protein AAF665_06020 [Pseudomonadota bacterium]